jgi:hypothetical protein
MEKCKEFLTNSQIKLLSLGAARIHDFLTDKEINLLKDKGKIRLEDNRICVRKVFRLTEENTEFMSYTPYKKSEVLHKALQEFFHLFNYKEKGKAQIKRIKIDRKKSALTGLWIELGINEQINTLLKDDKTLTMQQVCNHALEGYFGRNREIYK